MRRPLRCLLSAKMGLRFVKSSAMLSMALPVQRYRVGG
nr:MAG TPA: hypothetical protein [Caudoviricetes sp.]